VWIRPPSRTGRQTIWSTIPPLFSLRKIKRTAKILLFLSPFFYSSSSESSNRATRVRHGGGWGREARRSPCIPLIGLTPVRREIWIGRLVGEGRLGEQRPPCLGPGSRMRWRCRGGPTTGAVLHSLRLRFPL
jgi:hypothetical protein